MVEDVAYFGSVRTWPAEADALHRRDFNPSDHVRLWTVLLEMWSPKAHVKYSQFGTATPCRPSGLLLDPQMPCSVALGRDIRQCTAVDELHGLRYIG